MKLYTENAHLYPLCLDEEGLVEWSTQYAFEKISKDYDGNLFYLMYDLALIGYDREKASIICSYIEHAINVECDQYMDDDEDLMF